MCPSSRLFSAFFFSSRRRHTRCALVTGVQTCALPIFIALFGAALAGKPFVPLNYRLTPAETARLIERLHPVYLIVDDEKADGITRHEATVAVRVSDFLADVVTDVPSDREAADDADGVAVQIGRASCRERGCKSVYSWGGAGY